MAKTMLDIFNEVLSESPVKPNIISIKDANSKCILRMEHNGMATTVDLKRSCNPGEERDYCWYVLCTAMSNIYVSDGDLKRGKLWLDAIRDRSLITTETA